MTTVTYQSNGDGTVLRTTTVTEILEGDEVAERQKVLELNIVQVSQQRDKLSKDLEAYQAELDSFNKG